MRVIFALIMLLAYAALAYGDELEDIDEYYDAMQRKNELLNRQEELDALMENGNNMINHLQGSLAENSTGPLNQKLGTMLNKAKKRNKEREEEKKANQAEISKIDEAIKKIVAKKDQKNEDNKIFYYAFSDSPFYQVEDNRARRMPTGVNPPAVGGQAQEYKPLDEALKDL